MWSRRFVTTNAIVTPTVRPAGRRQVGSRPSGTTLVTNPANTNTKTPAPVPLSMLPTKTLLRSLLLTSMMKQSWLMKPCLALLNSVCKSKTALGNPDRNPILNKLLRWTIYNHFAAGTCPKEVAKTAAEIKQMGYQGIILGYAKEVVLKEPLIGVVSTVQDKYLPCHYDVVRDWKRGTLDTLRMIEPGDFLAVKYVPWQKIYS